MIFLLLLYNTISMYYVFRSLFISLLISSI